MKVVIDADQMIYACGFASEGEPLSHTFKLIKNALNQIIEDTEADEWDVFIAGEGNFRDDLTFDYKATRTGRKPDSYNDCRQYLIDNWSATKVDGMEADDQVSLMLYEDFIGSGGKSENSYVILSSPDKDLKNTPGWHYNPRTREKAWITEKQADRHFWYQMLEGDRVDNIKGLPYCAKTTRDKFELSAAARKGCGKGTATKIMKASPKDYVLAVHEAYVEWGLEEGKSRDEVYSYMELQGQLLWMARELDEYSEPVLFKLHGALFDDVWKESDK